VKRLPAHALPPVKTGKTKLVRNRKKTEWHNVIFFGKLAEITGEYLKKGSLAYIEGRLQTRSFEKDGDSRYMTEIVADSMKMLPNGKKQNDSSNQQTAADDSGPF